MTERQYDSEGNWIDPDDAPEWTEEEWERAEIRIGDTIIRPGRPKGSGSKQPVSLRLDKDVLAHFRATGPGWQSRMNEALKKAAGL